MRGKMKLKKREKANKGITLIALVITIIVLLILAAVSIATLTGENGILTEADTAQKKAEREEAKEQAKLDIATWIADKIENGESTALNDTIIQSILTGKEYVKQAKEHSFTTKNNELDIPYSELNSNNLTGGDTPETDANDAIAGVTEEGIPIPKGFYAVAGTKDSGFVISDVEGDDLENSKQGNQFVWIPVPDIEDFHMIQGYASGDLQKIDLLEPYTEGYETEEEEYNTMKESVQKNQGFYLGSYEAGKEDDKVVVKKNKTPYNRLIWGKSVKEPTGGAVELAKNFAIEKQYTSVTSTLCYGVQWDATMQFFDSDYINGTCLDNSYVKNSIGKANYEVGKCIETGSNDAYEVKHIYDMAGNVKEWTMEGGSSQSKILRGGSYGISGAVVPTENWSVSSRQIASVTYSNSSNEVGFRVALYLKN